MRTPTNIHVDNYSKGSGRGRVSIGWELNGLRYHVWVDVETMEIERAVSGRMRDVGGTIYKNPPLGVNRRAPGYFHPVPLDATAKANAPIVEQVFAVVKLHGMIEKAIAQHEAEEKEKLAGYAAARKLAAIEAAGPELLEALRYVVMPTNLPPEQVTPEILGKVLNAIENARALIAKLDGSQS